MMASARPAVVHLTRQQQFPIIQYLRKLSPCSVRGDDTHNTVEPHDPLDICRLIPFPLRLT